MRIRQPGRALVVEIRQRALGDILLVPVLGDDAVRVAWTDGPSRLSSLILQDREHLGQHRKAGFILSNLKLDGLEPRPI